MGVVLMSKRELNRIDVLARLDGRRLTTLAAADLMRVTLRQTHRLLKRYRDGGAPAIANRRRGRPSNNRLSDVVRDHAVPHIVIASGFTRDRGCMSKSVPPKDIELHPDAWARFERAAEGGAKSPPQHKTGL